MSRPTREGTPNAARRFAARSAIALLVGLVLAALSDGRQAAAPPRAEVKLVNGTFSHSNSRSGSPILTATGLKPGESRAGTVVIANDGTIPGSFTLSKSNLSDTPGPNGGALSGRLDLLVDDVTGPGAPATVYSGKLAAMPARALGVLTAAQSRTYRFTVSFPDGGAPPGDNSGDNLYKGSSTSVRFDWTSTDLGTPPPDGPPPPPTQSPPATGVPPADTRRPVLRLSGRKVQRLKKKGMLSLTARADEAVSLSATGRAKGPRAVKKAVRLRAPARPAASNFAVQVRLKLSKKALRAAKKALARRKKVTVTVTVTAVDAAGNRALARRTIKLRR